MALVNCLNFGNPEHPEVMWQLSEAIDGMAEACRALAIPVIGGNVSLYNESAGADIDPTPVVAVLGVIDDLRRRPPCVELREGGALVLVGAPTAALAGSRWAVERRGHRGGALPPLDLQAVDAVLSCVRRAVANPGLLDGLHDVSAGGIGLALAEYAVRSGVGFSVGGPGVADHAELFAESPGRVVVCTHRPDELYTLAADAGVPATFLGRAGGRD